MTEERIQQLAIVTLIHRYGNDDFKFKNMRSRVLGPFATECNLKLSVVESWYEEFIPLMHIRYQRVERLGQQSSEGFGAIALALLLYHLATEGINFSRESKRIGNLCDSFKVRDGETSRLYVAREEYNEFCLEILMLLHKAHIMPPERVELE